MLIHVMHVPGADPMRDRAVAAIRSVAGWDVCVHEDSERRGVMATWIDALACSRQPTHQPWRVVVQDDARVLNETEKHLPQVLATSPSSIVGLSWAGRWAAKGRLHKKAFVRGPNIVQGVAVAYYESEVAGLLDFAQTVAVAVPDWEHDDLAANIYSSEVLDENPCVVSFPVFGYWRTKSLLGHGRYNEAEHTIDNLPKGFEWHPSSVISENKYADKKSARSLIDSVFRRKVSCM